MVERVLIIHGHPDSDRTRFNYQLAEAYKESALNAGFSVKEIHVADLDFPLLRSQHDYYDEKPVSAIEESQESIGWADHIMIIYPLWLGGMPALLKGFLEQILRPGFAYDMPDNKLPKKLLKGKSVRIIVTMGMPAFAYRWYFFAHSLKSLQRNILGFCGFSPVRSTLIGLIDTKNTRRRQKWIKQVQRLGSLGI